LTLIQAMQRHPAVTTPDATLCSAAKQMASERTSVMPVVVKQQKMVGMLSAFDLVAGTLGGGLDPDRRTVRDLMWPDPATCRAEDSLTQVRDQMLNLRATVLPVVQANGELLGLVDLFDIADAADNGMAAGPEPDMVKRVRGEPL